MPFEQAMDDVLTFGQGVGNVVPQTEVLLGVYGSEDWVRADHLRRRHLAGLTTVQIDITWLVPSTFSLVSWAATNVKTYTFFGASHLLVQEKDGLLQISSSRGKVEVSYIGAPEWAQAWIARFDGTFKRAESLIQWVYSLRGDEISVPLNHRPVIKSAYPWLARGLDEYIDEYLASEASVLILIGPPGTGKTTFIKNLIHRSGSNAKVAYDEKIMMDDNLFANFIDDDSRFLVMEDADAFLQARSDGNTIMHKFLNVSDGLISAVDKKLVFSTNIPNIRDIDAALIRPGRCFDVLEFKALTIDEASAVIEESGMGKLPPHKVRITLAEIFSTQVSTNRRRRSGMGFI